MKIENIKKSHLTRKAAITTDALGFMLFIYSNHPDIYHDFFLCYKGIYKNEGPFDVYVDLHRVKELFSYEVIIREVLFSFSKH